MASDKKALEAEPPHHRHTCRISLAPSPPGQRGLVAPFPALKLPLIITGKGVGREQGMGLDKPRKENRDRPKNALAPRPWPRLIKPGRG